MPTMIYSPGIKVYVDTENHGTLDLSEDITDGNMVRRSDGVSTFTFSLQNTRRKYDGKFTPNDRIIVLMKRITWVQVFTGYLNSVPLITAWPKVVQVSASCSLKRLQYWYWDPYSAAAYNLTTLALLAPKNGDNQNTDECENKFRPQSRFHSLPSAISSGLATWILSETRLARR